MKRIIFYLICFVFNIQNLLSQSLMNNPNFTLRWHEEFDGNTLNTNWTIDTFTAHGDTTGYLNYVNNVNNVKVENGWLKLRTTKGPFITAPSNGSIQQSYNAGSVNCPIPSFNNAIYEIEAKFNTGVNAGFSAWFWGGNGDCPQMFNYNYQEIDILEFLGNTTQKTSGGIHRCVCQCANNDWNCRRKLLCRDLNPNSEYSLENTEQSHTYFTRWTNNAGIWIGQDYNVLRSKVPTPAHMNTNLPGKRFVLAMNAGECQYYPWKTECSGDSKFPYWYDINYVRIFTAKLDCNTVVTQIPNFNTFNFAIKKSYSLSNSTSVPSNSNVYLYATDFVEFTNGFTLPANTNLTVGLMDCN